MLIYAQQTLVFVATVTKHRDRTPCAKQESKENDFDSTWNNMDSGALTTKSKVQAKDLGKELRQKEY